MKRFFLFRVIFILCAISISSCSSDDSTDDSSNQNPNEEPIEANNSFTFRGEEINIVEGCLIFDFPLSNNSARYSLDLYGEGWNDACGEDSNDPGEAYIINILFNTPENTEIVENGTYVGITGDSQSATPMTIPLVLFIFSGDTGNQSFDVGDGDMIINKSGNTFTFSFDFTSEGQPFFGTYTGVF